MPDSMLRRARKAQTLTQAQLAEQVGVNQATLARWETGKAAIPEEKAALLAALLGVPVRAIESRSDSITPSVPPQIEELVRKDASQYFGEVAIHFRSGGRPLMVSIDEHTRSRIYEEMQKQSSSAVVFTTLDNRTVFLRKAAISELHFSSDAVGTYGPEHGRYGEPVAGIASTDEECFADPASTEAYDPVDALAGNPVQCSHEFWEAIRYHEAVGDELPTSVQAEVEQALRSNLARTYTLLSHYMFWQVEGSQRRGMLSLDGAALSDFWFELEVGLTGNSEVLQLCCGSAGGYHHSVLVNFGALEYLTVPTHLLSAANHEAAVRDGVAE